MTFALFFIGLFLFLLLTVWLGRGDPNSSQAPDTALGAPGSVGRDLGPLTDAEWTAHEEMLRETKP